MKKKIYLQQIGEFDRPLLTKLKKCLKWSFKPFNVSIGILDNIIELKEADYEPQHNTLNADLIMLTLFKLYKKAKYFRILGILDKDIYVRRRHHIFGTARDPNKIYSRFPPIALISTYRLHEENWDFQENSALFDKRLVKEALHELGHTFGLFHCENQCVMIQSTKIEDIDNKPSNFCESCIKDLKFFFQYQT